ncbi:MAG TPA: anti-sigma factor, partial [Egibacteraceae bacterium]|nr:anti-sigma factor [Egibacteraceae bacterium]
MTADIHTLAGAYALHALSDEEERLFLRHLAVCDSCQTEVAEFERTAALLGGAVEEPPPAGMRAAVLAAVDRTPQVRDGLRPPGWRERIAPVLMPVAAGLGLVVMALGGVAFQQARELRDLRATQTATSEALLAVLGAPDLERIAMTGDGTATVLWSPAGRQAVLVAEGLAPPPQGKAYQLWLLRDGVPVPSQVFRPGPDGAVVAYLATVPDAFQAAGDVSTDSHARQLTGPARPRSRGGQHHRPARG